MNQREQVAKWLEERDAASLLDGSAHDHKTHAEEAKDLLALLAPGEPDPRPICDCPDGLCYHADQPPSVRCRRIAAPQSREHGEEMCGWCEDMEDHFELAETPSEVVHTYISGPTGWCLTCHNHSAHPWHEEPPALESIKEIEKYLDTMGFHVMRKGEPLAPGEPVAWWEITVRQRNACYTTKDARAAERVSQDDGAVVRPLVYADELLALIAPGEPVAWKLEWGYIHKGQGWQLDRITNCKSDAEVFGSFYTGEGEWGAEARVTPLYLAAPQSRELVESLAHYKELAERWGPELADAETEIERLERELSDTKEEVALTLKDNRNLGVQLAQQVAPPESREPVGEDEEQALTRAIQMLSGNREYDDGWRMESLRRLHTKVYLSAPQNRERESEEECICTADTHPSYLCPVCGPDHPDHPDYGTAPPESRDREAMEALAEAVECIKVFHGPVGWEEYQQSPEMKRFRHILGEQAQKGDGDE